MPRRADRRRSCDKVREALSAGLDGEASPAERAAAEVHMASCIDCRAWFDQAATVTRLIRTSPAATGPDVTPAVLPAAPRRWRARLGTGLRLAVGVIGAVQLTLGIAQASMAAAADGHTHGGFGGASLGHLGHESAAWSLGMAAGFLWVASRRSRPAAILPILTAFVGIVVLLNAADLATGRIDVGHAVTHASEVVGLLLVMALSRPSLSDQAPPPGQVHENAHVDPTTGVADPPSPPGVLRSRRSSGVPAAVVRNRRAA